jgi:spore germination cell wall hydrolase CwlJ-like protein
MDPMTTAALTVYGEARGEGDQGKIAVAWVIKNRADNPRWWGSNISEVCLKPSQFSCWNPGDPNRKLLEAPRTRRTKAFSGCWYTVFHVLRGVPEDPTDHADHYCTLSSSPHWAKGKSPVATIGNHHFYRLEL